MNVSLREGTKRTGAVAMGVLFLLLAGPAWAQSSPVAQGTVDAGALAKPSVGVTFSVGVYGIGRSDVGYKLFDGGRGGAATGLDASFDFHVAETVRLAVGAGFMAEDHGRRDDAATSASLSTSSGYLSAALRWRADKTWQPYVAGAGGLTSAQLKLIPSTTEGSIDARGFFARASAGIRLAPLRTIWRRTSGAPVLGWALALEGGALFGQSLDFSSKPAIGTSTSTASVPAIAVSAVSVGRLSQTGGYGCLKVLAAF